LLTLAWLSAVVAPNCWRLCRPPWKRSVSRLARFARRTSRTVVRLVSNPAPRLFAFIDDAI
jgi:hypothetical protein